jgi:hypothetical protein
VKLAAALLLVIVLPGLARAQGEGVTEERPAAESVDEYPATLEERPEEAPEGRFDAIEKRLEDIEQIPEGSRLEFRFRSYYLRNVRLDSEIREAWTWGGSIFGESGWIAERLKLGAELFTSQPIIADEDRDGTGLLAPGQQGYTVLGQLFARVRIHDDHEARLYRQAIDLPYINRRDSRMTPQTFELWGVDGRFGAVDRYPNLRYFGGYVREIKLRNADQFISMGEAAAPDQGSNSGTWVAGVLLNPRGRVAIGISNYYTADIFNLTYAEAVGSRRWSNGLAARTTLQFTEQHSVGAELAGDSPFETWIAAGEVSASYLNVTLRVAFSTTGAGSGIRSPWGSPPTPVALMLRNFDRAGEDAWLVGTSYNLRRLGFPSLSAFVNFARGNDARDPVSRSPLADIDELDLTLDWRPENGVLRGIWFRLRGAFLREVGGGTENQLRVIVKYDLPML